MSTKLIITDLDGTLLHSDGRVSEKTISFLLEYQRNGGFVVLATSRHWGDCDYIARRVLKTNHGFVATSNGQYIYDSMGIIIQQFDGLTFDDYYLVKELFPKDRIIAVTDGIDYVYPGKQKCSELIKCIISNIINKHQKRYLIRNKINYGVVVEKIIIANKLSTEIEKHLVEKYNITYKGKDYFEIQSCLTDKLFAIKWMMEKLHIDATEAIVFGDDDNDVHMLLEMPNSVAMGNANEKIKQCAKNTTLTNDEDGLLYYIERLQKLEVNN